MLLTLKARKAYSSCAVSENYRRLSRNAIKDAEADAVSKLDIEKCEFDRWIDQELARVVDACRPCR